MTWGNDPPVPPPPPWSFRLRPDLPRDRCNMVVQLRNRKNPNKQMIRRVLCLTWGCATCGPILKRRWSRQLTDVGARIGEIYQCASTAQDWPTLQRRINRLGGQFFRVEFEDSSVLVFTNVAAGELLPLGLREDYVEAVIDAACSRRNAITTSRSWALKRESKSKKKEWRRVRWLPITLENAIKVVHELGLEVPLFVTIGPSWVVIVLPDSWLADDEKGYKFFCKRLEWGPSGPADSESETLGN